MARRAARRGRRLQLLGLAVAGYGVIGIVLFIVVALSISRPLERAQRLSSAVETQRGELVETLEQAEDTIRQMSEAVGRMDGSLGEAKAATDRASGIAHGVAASMYQLRDAMYLSILGAQPLIGLAGGFDTSGQQLDLLGTDLTAIGAALEVNRGDVVTTSSNMSLLAASVDNLATAVRATPRVEISLATLDAVRFAVYAVAGWMVLLAVGCVVLGLYLIVVGRRAGTA